MMRRTAAVFLLILAFISASTAARAEQPGIVASLKWPTSLSADPGTMLAMSFEVRNTGADPAEVVERLSLPDGWRWVTSPGTLTLAPGQSRIRLHSVAVPAYAAAGDYNLAFELLDATGSTVQASTLTTFRVAGVARLAVQSLSAPARAVAGSSYVVRFMVTNAGNAAAQIGLEAKAQEGFSLTYDRRVQLAAGESRIVDVTVKSSKSLRDTVTHRLTLVASSEQATARASAAMEVIPEAAGEGRILFPLQLQGKLGVGAPAPLLRELSLTLTGKGYIDEAKSREVALSLGTRSANFVTYRSPALQLILGNAPFGLSALTSSIGTSTLGVGVGVAPVRREGLALEANLVANKFGRIASTELKLGLAPGWTVLLEAAVGARGGDDADGPGLAGRAEVAVRPGKAAGDYRLALSYAQSGFPGRYGQGLLVEGSAKLPMWGRLSAEGQVTGSLAHGDESEWAWQYGARVNLRYATGGWAWASYGFHDEYGSETDVDKFAVGITQRLRLGTADARYEWRLDEPSADSLRVSLDFSRIARRHYGAYYTATGIRSGDGAVHTVGAKASLWTGSRGWAGLDISRTFGATSQSTSIGASARYDIADWLMLQAEAKATKRAAGEWDVSGKLALTATQRFNVPVGRKTSVGTLTGRVFDALGEGTGYAGVAVRVGKAAAMTAADGTFQFRGLEPGMYYAQVDMANLPDGAIPDLMMPAIVMIEAGRENHLDIPITRKSSIHGKVTVYAQADPRPNGTNGTNGGNGKNGTNGTNGVLKEAGPLARVMVSAVMGDEKRFAMTDAEGRFSFIEMRPGNWEIRVVANGRMPEGYMVEQEVQVVNVAPGGRGDTLFRVVPRPRELKMLNGGSLGMK